MRRILALILATGMAAAAGPALAQPPLPYAPVPPPRHEVVPRPPGGRYAWVPGHWQWTGHRYTWINGRYEVRQRHWGHYERGGWVWNPRANQWVWQPAHWR